MKTFNLSTIAVFAILSGSQFVTAVLNCRGSGNCNAAGCGNDAMHKICDKIESLASANPDTTVTSGQHIACNKAVSTNGGGCCAFFQGTGGTYAGANTACQQLVEHGCVGCGSVSAGDGQFTVNYVANTV